MPAVSKAQFRFMQAVKHGDIKKKGLSEDKASEFVDDVSYKGLPAKKMAYGGYAEGGEVDGDTGGEVIEENANNDNEQEDPRDPEMMKAFAEALKKRKKGTL